MKIVGVEPHYLPARRPLVLVKVTTDTGLYGWGEATLEGKEATVMQAVCELARYLTGRDPFRIEDHWQQMYRGAFWVGGPVLNSAISGVEQALWDLKGKAYGAPVYELLGGKVRDRLRAYANGWFHGAQSVDDYVRMAKETVARGYTALKWDPFGKSGLFISNDEADAAVENVRAIREAVGPKIDLLIEVHGRFSPANAIRVAQRLEPFFPFWYEEPIPPENIDALATVARAVRFPIASGERLFTKWGFKEIIEKQAAAVVQPDICHAGGIWELRKIAAMAEVYYIGMAPHNPNGPIATMASIHLDACTPNFLIQEYVVDEHVGYDGLIAEPPVVENGYFLIPDRPGLGIEVDESLLDRGELVPMDMYPMIVPT